MNNSQMIEQEKSVLRWGGLAGILGGILFILVMVFVAVAIGSGPADLTEVVARFPDIHMLRVIENGIYLVALLLEILLFLALFWALRKSSLAPALFGTTLGIVGLVSMAISATPHVAHYPLSELFQATGTTPEAQETIALMWQGTWGVFDAPLYVGFFVVPLGLILLGIAMFGTSDFGKGLGWMSIVIGIVAFVAAILQMIDPASDIGALSYLLPIIFYIVLGRKILSLSKAP
jgi:hypothetical protein